MSYIVKLEVDAEWVTIPGGPTGEVRTRILRPPGATHALPVIFYIHGAGWVFGNSHTHDRLVREVAVAVGAAVVFPEYSLSPEVRYPTAIEESYAVLEWVAEHGAEKNLDASRIAIAGEADVLRDEGEAYGRKLRQAGVDVTATRYEGIIHDFVMLNALRVTNAAGAAINQAVTFLRDALAVS